MLRWVWSGKLVLCAHAWAESTRLIIGMTNKYFSPCNQYRLNPNKAESISLLYLVTVITHCAQMPMHNVRTMIDLETDQQTDPLHIRTG